MRGTIGSLLEGLSDAERAQIHLIAFIAHTDPTVHPIYHEPRLIAVSNTVLTYDIPQEDIAKPRIKESGFEDIYVDTLSERFADAEGLVHFA